MNSKIRSVFTSLMFAAIAFTATAAFAGEAKVPQTVADHETLAQKYKSEASGYRKTAEEHKQMAEAYARKHPDDAKRNVKNPWNIKMQKHCMGIAQDAEKLAIEAEKAAEYHTLRGKELQGK